MSLNVNRCTMLEIMENVRRKISRRGKNFCGTGRFFHSIFLCFAYISVAPVGRTFFQSSEFKKLLILKNEWCGKI